MPGGGQVRLIRPWNLAAETLLYSVACLGTLLAIFAVPEIIRAGMYFAYDLAVRAGRLPSWWSTWVLDLASYVISAVIFTGIIHHVAFAETPSRIPNPRLAQNYILTATTLIVIASTVEFITGGWLLAKLYAFKAGELYPFDERDALLWSAAYSTMGFFLSAILIAGSYPLLGLTALHGRLGRVELVHLFGWDRKNFWRFLVLTLLLMCVCLALRRAYWWALNTFVPNVTSDLYYLEHENLRSMVVQVINVPVDMVFDIIPPVAIGLLYRVLRASSVR